MSSPLPPQLLSPEPGPATLKHRRWGGTRLATLRAAPPSVERPIGESWEFSTLPGSESRSRDRELGALLGRPIEFLAKLIDTAMPLSVQVHPDDDVRTGRPGKEEAWVILDADPAARLGAGIRPGVDRATFVATARRAAADAAAGPDLMALLHFVPALPGTVLLIPAGLVHVIGGGILLAEIQQPTDVTYRLFDHGSGRDLQLEQAIAATAVAVRAQVLGPGDAPARLTGKHLALDVLGPGRHPRQALHDDLIVPGAGGCLVTTANDVHELPIGALRLATPHLPYTIDVGPGGRVVVGTCSPTS